VDRPTHLSSLLVRRSQGTARAHSYSPSHCPPPFAPLSSGAVDHGGELCISVTRRPHCELVLSTVSGGCTMAHGCFLWAPSHRPTNRHPALPALYTAPLRLGRHHVCHARRVGGDMGIHTLCYGPCQARPCRPHALCV
jgi:hypothetical protein